MYPHERSLVKRMQNKPFALLGINTDQSRPHVKEVLKKENITWPSWFDGGTSGPIDTAWEIDHWPTIYVLDAKGIIRHIDIGAEELDKAVNELLKETDAKAGANDATGPGKTQ